MDIASSALDFNEQTGILPGRKDGAQLRPVTRKVRDELVRIGNPLVKEQDDLAGQDSIFFQQREDASFFAHLTNKIQEALFSGLSSQVALKAGNVHFKYERFTYARNEVFRERWEEELDNMLRFKREGGLTLKSCVELPESILEQRKEWLEMRHSALEGPHSLVLATLIARAEGFL